MGMRRRTRYSLMGTAAVLVLLVIAVVLRKEAPPECARLLPESDAIVYFNVKAMRLVTEFDRKPVIHSPEYQHFIDATGFDFERDLDHVAFALHRMPNPNGPNGPVAYSEVSEGKIDGKRFTAYLSSVATAKETYAGHDIFSIPMEGRTLRVVLLGYEMVGGVECADAGTDSFDTRSLPLVGFALCRIFAARRAVQRCAAAVGGVGDRQGGGCRLKTTASCRCLG